MTYGKTRALVADKCPPLTAECIILKWLTTERVSMLMATLILITLKDFGEITASVQSMVYIIVLVANTYQQLQYHKSHLLVLSNL